MKSIVYILPYLDKGGTETHVLELIKGFKDKYNIILLAPPGPRLAEFKNYNIDYIPFTKLDQNLIRGLLEFKKGIKKIKKLEADIIHIHAAHELILLTRFFIKNIPIIFTIHGYQNRFDYYSSTFINNMISKNVIAVSNAEKKILLKSGIKREKLELIYNSISLPEYFSINNVPKKIRSFKSNSNKIILGTIARLEKKKGLQYLIKAINEMKNKNFHLLIIGSGKYKEKLQTQVKKFKLEDKISFIGYVENIHDYLELIDIFILPSLKESFGLVCIEAMAHKLPVIASNTGGLPEIIEDNSTGFIVPPRDSFTLAIKIDTLIKKSSLRKKMGKAAYLRFAEFFNINIILKKTEKLYLKYL